MWPPAGSPPRNVPPPSRRGGSPDPPADFPPQRLELEQSDAPVWSSAAARLNFGPTAAAAWMRGQSLSLPRLTVFGSPLELGLVFSGGRGENELEPEGTCSRRRCESPPAILWFLSHRWERNSPKGRNPPRGMKPVPKPAGGSGDPPLRGGWGDIPWRRTGGRLSELFSLTINFAPQGEPLHPKIRMEGFPVFYISIVTGA